MNDNQDAFERYQDLARQLARSVRAGVVDEDAARKAWTELVQGGVRHPPGAFDDALHFQFAFWDDPDNPLNPAAGTRPRPIDWPSFWKTERDDTDWLIPDFWPRGRAMALWAPAKEGKTELVHYLCLCLVTGRDPWTGADTEPVTVDYFDWELTRDDLEDKFTELGYGPDDVLSRFNYYLLPEMPPLDTAAGGDLLRIILDEDQPAAVVLDTFSRAVEGDEDRANTVRAFYNHTGLHMKAKRIGYLRADHAGKDITRGQRGTSAKNDDVDVVWKLTKTARGAKLTALSRVSWVPGTLELDRGVDPATHYRRPLHAGDEYLAGTKERAAELDLLDIDPTWGRPKVVRWLQEHGHRVGTAAVLADAIRYRKDRAERGAER